MSENTDRNESSVRENRVPIMMSEAELLAVDDWRFANRVATRSGAIRRLVATGLASAREGTERMTSTPSKDRAEEARDLGLDLMLCTEAEEAILKASYALDKAFAEGIKRATDALDKYRASLADIPLGHENPHRGASTYNWKVAVFEEIRDAILAEIGER